MSSYLFFWRYRLIPIFFLIVCLLILFGCGSDDEEGSSGPSVVYLWRSATPVDGNLGGLNGANSTCETDGASVSFPTSVGNHRALIATSSNDPRTYFSNNPPTQRSNGTLITDTYSDFFNSSTTASTSTITIGLYWTGLANTGNIATNNCNNWTTTSGMGRLGDGSATDITRISRSNDNCSNNHLILCISY